MYDLQPQALTDKELIRYAESCVDKGNMPVAVQVELIKRIEKLVASQSLF
jgi:hypothetical protein